jgi:hypothetical protein
VTFETSGSIAEPRGYVKSRRSFVNEGKREIENLRKELGQTRDRARRDRLVRELERRLDALREIQKELVRGLENLQKLVASGGPDVVRFRIGSERGILLVREIEGAKYVVNVDVVRAFTESADAISPHRCVSFATRSYTTRTAVWCLGRVSKTSVSRLLPAKTGAMAARSDPDSFSQRGSIPMTWS